MRHLEGRETAIDSGGWEIQGKLFIADANSGVSIVGCLISATIIGGFEYAVHNFMRTEFLKSMVSEEQFAERGRWPRKGGSPIVKKLLLRAKKYELSVLLGAGGRKQRFHVVRGMPRALGRQQSQGETATAATAYHGELL